MKSISNVRETADLRALNPSDYVDVYVITAGDANAVAVTVPTGAKYAVFSATNNFYVMFKNTSVTVATLPTVTITNGSFSVLNPTSARIDFLTNFSIVVPTTCNVTISWYTE